MLLIFRTQVKTKPISVQEAMKRGSRVVARPPIMIIVLCFTIAIALPIAGFSLWLLLFIPASLVLSFVYTSIATPIWRLWAYEHVNDIHQFQRSAELEGLLTRERHDKPSGLMSLSQRIRLGQFQERFSEDAMFVDDYSVPDEMVLGFNEPIVILNDVGIEFRGIFVEWKDVMNERIVRINTRGRYGRGGEGHHDYFRFETATEWFETSLSSIGMNMWRMDYVLYIYRGRGQFSRADFRLG